MILQVSILVSYGKELKNKSVKLNRVAISYQVKDTKHNEVLTK